jgi:hypothetical protein
MILYCTNGSAFPPPNPLNLHSSQSIAVTECIFLERGNGGKPCKTSAGIIKRQQTLPIHAFCPSFQARPTSSSALSPNPRCTPSNIPPRALVFGICFLFFLKRVRLSNSRRKIYTSPKQLANKRKPIPTDIKEKILITQEIWPQPCRVIYPKIAHENERKYW